MGTREILGVGVERWLTAGEVARELGVSWSRVQRMAAEPGLLGRTTWRRLGDVVRGLKGQRATWRIWPESAVEAEIARRCELHGVAVTDGR